jgi:uncharacterized Zn-binding protein involved in type VI secretion
MGKPAARLGDMTMHGGSIVLGFPMVLIGGMPAARIGDMHVCPMLTPGVPPIPHVGGPVVLGSPMVLIGGMPAARMGDMLVCVGPPDTIALGCPTVLIGEGGSGSASGGGVGFKAVAVAKASALRAINGSQESTTKIEHWVEFEFVDKAGLPVSGVNYKLTDTANKESGAVLRMDGRIRRDNIKQGQAKVQLFNLSNAKWSKDKADVGEKVKLTADVVGFEDGTKATIEIYKRDIKGTDAVIETIETKIKSKKVEFEWKYKIIEEDDSETNGRQEKGIYSNPEYYFEIIIGRIKTRSGLLAYKDFIEIELKNIDDKPITNAEYIVYLETGEIRKGKLDSNGLKKIGKLPPVRWKVEFPDHPLSIYNSD